MQEKPGVARLPSRPSILGDAFELGGDFRGGQVNVKSTIYQYAPPPPVAPDLLEAAQSRVAEMPLGAASEPSPLPPRSRMSLSVNPLFVGRHDELERMARALQPGGAVALAGLGGVGKTQLASSFVHCYGTYFQGGVFWLSFAEPATIPSEVAACGGAGALMLRPDFFEMSQEDQVRLVLAAWGSPLPRLLVFDNCEAEELLARWRPTSGGCRLLVTSRRTRWSRALGLTVLPLGVFQREESVELLRKHRPDVETSELDEVAAELGDLPLALHLAGSFLARYEHSELGSPSAYLERLRDERVLDHPSLTSGDFSPTGHEQHVARTIALSYEQLDGDDAVDGLALALLERAACLELGEPIPRSLLRRTVELSEDEGGEDEDEAETRFEEALSRLVGELGLLEEGEDGALVLHRVLGAYLEKVRVDFSGAVLAVVQAVLQESVRLRGAAPAGDLKALEVHLRGLADAFAKHEQLREDAGALYNQLGLHLLGMGDYPGAKEAFEKAVSSQEAAKVSDESKLATYLSNLGSVLVGLGDLAEARRVVERSVSVAEEVFGPESYKVVSYLDALAVVLANLLGLQAAREALERAIRITENELGADHPDCADRLRALSSILDLQGDSEGARRTLDRALPILERATAKERDRPELASYFRGLGDALSALGELDAARKAFERALAIDEAVFGPDSPRICKNLDKLSAVLVAHEEHDEARKALERTVSIGEAALGSGHPQVADSLHNLGKALLKQGRYQEAQEALEQAMSMTEEVLGPAHPSMAELSSALGETLEALGDQEGAGRAFETALSIAEAVFGPEHWRTAAAAAKLLERLGLERLGPIQPVEAFRTLRLVRYLEGFKGIDSGGILKRIEEQLVDIGNIEDIQERAVKNISQNLALAEQVFRTASQSRVARFFARWTCLEVRIGTLSLEEVEGFVELLDPDRPDVRQMHDRLISLRDTLATLSAPSRLQRWFSRTFKRKKETS